MVLGLPEHVKAPLLVPNVETFTEEPKDTPLTAVSWSLKSQTLGQDQVKGGLAPGKTFTGPLLLPQTLMHAVFATTHCTVRVQVVELFTG